MHDSAARDARARKPQGELHDSHHPTAHPTHETNDSLTETQQSTDDFAALQQHCPCTRQIAAVNNQK
jgi:hypothetical protein